jgi:glucose-1-phosphate adenylyltransferase
MVEPIRSALRPLAARTLAVVLAGGKGSRLGELTRRQAKPALPFGGQYRNIDFTLSNCVNSGLRQVAVLTQYRPHSLRQHVQKAWKQPAAARGFIEVWPSRQHGGHGSYRGTADAVYRNLDRIGALLPDYVIVLAGDHVYRMDYRPMLDAHAANGAGVTVGCIEVPLGEASAFGVVAVDGRSWIRHFDEKPETPVPLPQQPGFALASMGIYVFDRELLVEALRSDAADAASRHDFGRNVLPALVREGRALAYPFRNPGGGRAYWRDVGTLDSYWQANLELLDDPPPLDLRDPSWPLRPDRSACAPPRFTDGGAARRSIVSGGCVVGGRVEQSLLSPDCRVGRGAHVEECVVLPRARIGRNCRIRRAVVAGGCVVPDGAVIGEDALRDAEFYKVSGNGVTLVTASGLARAARRPSIPAARIHEQPRVHGTAQPEALRGRQVVIANWNAP